ncbi:Seven transmembrane helix receptor [Escherichia coli P12b]|nr:Seven transmembrane helix receptor [Escherichia coli P12b]
MPVEVKERCCALNRIQPLRVECFTNYRVVFGIIQMPECLHCLIDHRVGDHRQHLIQVNQVSVDVSQKKAFVLV